MVVLFAKELPTLFGGEKWNTNCKGRATKSWEWFRVMDAETNPIKIKAIAHDRRQAPLWLEAMTFLWLVSTFALFPGNEFILYPLALAIFVVLYFERNRILPVLFRCWFLFLIPILCGFSYFWSAYPSSAMREALFFLLSALSMVVIGSLMTERQILRALFFCAIVGTGLAFSELETIRITKNSEALGQKNFYAMKMMISMIASFGVAANKDEHLILRLAGAALTPFCFYLVLAAESATALVLSLLALTLLVAGNWFWSNLRHVKGLRTVIGGVTIAGVLAILLIALSIFNTGSIEDAFQLVGRDSTFTGRTALWEQAQRTSAEHPILGVGAGGFWQYDIGAAQSLAINDHKAPGTVLGFHNSYLETQVHLGYVGLFSILTMVAITLWVSFKSFVSEGRVERVCFFTAALIVFSMSFTESTLFTYLNPGIYIFNLSVITVFATRLRRRPVTLNLTPVAGRTAAPAC